MCSPRQAAARPPKYFEPSAPEGGIDIERFTDSGLPVSYVSAPDSSRFASANDVGGFTQHATAFSADRAAQSPFGCECRLGVTLVDDAKARRLIEVSRFARLGAG